MNGAGCEAEPCPSEAGGTRKGREARPQSVTQNIDGLHQAAGSRNVYELHGSIHRNYCMKCGKFYDAGYVKNYDGVPRCECGGMIKPDVVLYEEGLGPGDHPGSGPRDLTGRYADHRRHFAGRVSGSGIYRLFPGKVSGSDQQVGNSEVSPGRT